MIARDRGFTLVELLIMTGLVSVVTALAATGLLDRKAAANEAAAIAYMRVTMGSQRAYADACGHGAYAASYIVLWMSPKGAGRPLAAEDLGSVLHPMRAGYQFSLAAGAGSAPGPDDCNGNPTVTGFYASAVPLSIVSGFRSFAATGQGKIWETSGGNAPAEPFRAPARAVQGR